MMEAAHSLMQMAKTSARLAQLDEAGIPFISLLTDPTTGGVTASYAMLGDLNIAEPGALIGFAGPRVVKETIGKDLPKGFQTAEFVLDQTADRRPGALPPDTGILQPITRPDGTFGTGNTWRVRLPASVQRPTARPRIER